jgi:RNA polymerase sigma-70 factor (ECF subfamily)
MFEMEGLSGDEIADVLEVPVGTVRSRLRLAREAFLSALGAAPDGLGVNASGGRT